MGTKWKNTIKQVTEFAEKNKHLLIGLLMIAVACVLLFEVLIRERYFYRPTSFVWIFGIFVNVFLGTGIVQFLRLRFSRKYENWTPADESFFDDWKGKWSTQQKGMLYIFIPVFLFVWFLTWTGIRWFGFYGNFAPMYMSMATVIIQYAVCQVYIIRFMKGKLNDLFECMRTVNRKELESAMEIERESFKREAKSEQLKVDLISNVSHDLKTPLTSLVGYVELLKKEDLDDVARDYVDVISDKAEKLKEMIESLFSIAKVSSGNVKLKPEEIELNRMIEQIFADMEDKIASSGLNFVKALSDGDTSMVTDNLYMYRICQNLIENAVKYSAKGTRVFVKTFVLKDDAVENDTAGKISMEITNTAGYEMDFDKDDIVERFARGDKARSGDGNGLGLAIVSTYASALGGSFDIKIDCDQFKATVTFPKKSGELSEKL